MLGKLLSLPIKIINVPFRLIDEVAGPVRSKDDRVASLPLKEVADVVEKASDAVEDEIA